MKRSRRNHSAVFKAKVALVAIKDEALAKFSTPEIFNADQGCQHTSERHIERLAEFYAAEATNDEAAKNIASHIRRSWEPRMRKAIIEHNKNGGAGLKDVAREAVALLAAL